ncbi:MAG: TRAP transporter substrate-binding protein DctP [Spirochaetales bacterium]
MSRTIKSLLCGLLVAALSIPVASAAPLVIKVGSVAPEATPWGESLNKLAAEWKRVSNGQVELKIYHGGIAGGESDSIRKMRLNQLQGAVVTSFGVNELTKDFLTLSIPFMIRTDAELDYVLSKLSDRFKAEVAAQKFHVFAWSKAGWVRFFSKTPLKVPADLKPLKLASNPVDQQMFEAWQSMGYNQVPVELPNTLTALNSGRIDALYASPIATGGFQWFGIAKYMASIRIAPFLGGILFTQATWDKIPANLKPALEAAAAPIMQKLDGDIQQMETDAIKTMKTYGLIETTVTPAEELVWKAEVDAGISGLLGKSFNKEVYEVMVASLAEFRKK